MAIKFCDFTIVIEAEEDPKEGFYACSPELPGCYSNGRTVEETRRNSVRPSNSTSKQA